MFTDDLISDSPYVFTDEAHLSATEKWQVLRDWQRFIRSGFKKLFFTKALYRQLQRCAFIAHFGRERFWAYYFSNTIDHLRMFAVQFGSRHRPSAEFGTPAWLDGETADLKDAMCQEMAAIYEPVCHLLDDLERQHTALVRTWHDFALTAGLEEVTLPPHYTISENTRSLLAFAIQIALKTKRPLTALQLQFPVPLLYPEVDVPNFVVIE